MADTDDLEHDIEELRRPSVAAPATIDEAPAQSWGAKKTPLSEWQSGIKKTPLSEWNQKKEESGVLSRAHGAGSESFSRAWEGVKEGLNPFNRDVQNPDFLGDLGKTGKGLLSAVELPFAYPMSAAASLMAEPQAYAGRKLIEGVNAIPGATQQPVPSQEELVNKLRPGSEIALGAIGANKFVPSTKLVPPRTGPVTDQMRLLSEEGRKTRAGQILEESATNPEAVRKSLEVPEEIVPGSTPTTFQATGDMGLGQLERASRTANPAEFNTRRAEQNQARLAALEDVQRTGSPEAVADHLRSVMRSDIAQLEQDALNARNRAWQQSHALGGEHDPATYGNILRHELRQAEDEARALEGALWQRVDPDGSWIVSPREVTGAARAVYGELGPAARAGLTEAERRIVDVIDPRILTPGAEGGGYGAMTPFRELTDLRSLVSTEMRQELATNGRTPAYGRLVQLRRSVEEAVASNVYDQRTEQVVRQAAERLRAASEATRDRATTFNAPPIKEILRREGMEGPYKLQEGAVVGKIVRPGRLGYDNARAFIQAVGPEEALPVLQDSIAASMRRAVMDRDGNINPERLTRWMETHQDVLSSLEPHDGGAFRQRLWNAGDASQVVADVARRRADILAEHERGIFGKLIGSTDKSDINGYIGSVFSGQGSVAKARALSRRMTTPEARDGARRSIVEWVQEKFISNTEAGTSEQNLIRADQFQKFMRENRAALLQFFNEDQLGTWSAIARDINRSNRSIVSSKIPGQSNTPQDLYAMQKSRSPTTSLMGRIATYLASGAIGVATHGVSLFSAAAGLVGGHIAVSLRDAGVRKVQQLVDMAMLDPVLARELLVKVKGKERVNGLRRWSMYEAGTHSRERDK